MALLNGILQRLAKRTFGHCDVTPVKEFAANSISAIKGYHNPFNAHKNGTVSL